MALGEGRPRDRRPDLPVGRDATSEQVGPDRGFGNLRGGEVLQRPLTVWVRGVGGECVGVVPADGEEGSCGRIPTAVSGCALPHGSETGRDNRPRSVLPPDEQRRGEGEPSSGALGGSPQPVGRLPPRGASARATRVTRWVTSPQRRPGYSFGPCSRGGLVGTPLHLASNQTPVNDSAAECQHRAVPLPGRL